jgi:HPt (histidine-containing phosphotransfer) domain-containing protein
MSSCSPPSEGLASAVLDEQALSRLRELDPSGSGRLLERVFSAFETSATRLMPQMAQARTDGNLDGVRFVAHTLKSSSASIGATRLWRCCERAELMAKQGESGATLDEQLDMLTGELDCVLAYLRSVRPAST